MPQRSHPQAPLSTPYYLQLHMSMPQAVHSSLHQFIRFRLLLTKATATSTHSVQLLLQLSSGTINSNSEKARPRRTTAIAIATATATAIIMAPPSANIFTLLSTDSEPVSDSPPSSPSSPTSTSSFTTAPSSPTTTTPSSSSSSDLSSFTPFISKRTLKKAALASTRRNAGPDAGPVGKGSAAPTLMGRKVASSWLDCNGLWHFVYEDELVRNHDREPGRRVLRGKGKGVVRNRK